MMLETITAQAKAAAEQLLAAAKPVYALTKVRFGQPFAVVRDPQTKAFRCFKYEINQEKYLIVEKKDDRFVARLEEIDYQTSLAVIKGEIRSRNRTRRKRGAGHCPCERLRFRNQFHQRSTGRRRLRGAGGKAFPP